MIYLTLSVFFCALHKRIFFKLSRSCPNWFENAFGSPLIGFIFFEFKSYTCMYMYTFFNENANAWLIHAMNNAHHSKRVHRTRNVNLARNRAHFPIYMCMRNLAFNFHIWRQTHFLFQSLNHLFSPPWYQLHALDLIYCILSWNISIWCRYCIVENIIIQNQSYAHAETKHMLSSWNLKHLCRFLSIHILTICISL